MPPGRSSTDTPLTRSRTSAENPSIHSNRNKAVASVERLLGLGRGELKPGLLLFAYLFLVIAATTMGGSVASSLFISRFTVVRLPFGDLASVAAVAVLMAGYVRLAQSIRLRSLLVASLVAFAVVSAGFWWLARHTPSDWLMAVLYVLVGIFGALALTQVWTLANYVLTLRQAKRLLPLVGSGSILGGICGGALTTAVTRARGSETLLLVIALAFATCAAIVPFLTSSPPSATRSGARRPQAKAPAASLRTAASLVSGSPYLKFIGVLIALTSFLATITKWQFFAIANSSLPQTDQFTAFLGSFSTATNALALAVQLLLATPILRRIGLGGALSIVPAALAAGSAGLLAFGSLAAVVVLRGSDLVLRYSIDRSARELLYLPLPRTETIQVKSFIDTVVSRSGDATASVIILLFKAALGRGFTPPQVASRLAWLTVALAGVWFVAARSIHRHYLRNLGDALRENRVNVQGVTAVLDRATTELLASHLGKGESKRVLSALSLVEASRASSVLPRVEALMTHPSAAVRARAVAVLSVSRPKSPPASIERLLFDQDLRVRSAALLYMAHAGLDPLERMQKAGEFEDLSVRSAMVVYLARGGKAQNLDACRELLDAMVHESGPSGRKARIEAARLMASLPNLFKEQLAELLADDDPDVARHAIRAVGRLRAGRFLPHLIESLAVPSLEPDATGALARFGNRIVPKLAATLADPGVSIEARRQIPKALLHIGSPPAEQTLIDHLGAEDAVLRFQVASSLNQLKRRHPEPPVAPLLVERALEVEILAQYRTYLSPASSCVPAVSREGNDRQLECIFRLLQLRLPGRDINSVHVGIQSADPVVRDKALEFLDNILEPQLRKMLVPLLDSKVEPEERAAIAGRLCLSA